MEHARTVQNKLWKYTRTIQESTAFHKILYAFEIVSLCSDLKERQANKPGFNYQKSFQCFDNVTHFIQNPKAVSLYSLAI